MKSILTSKLNPYIIPLFIIFFLDSQCFNLVKINYNDVCLIFSIILLLIVVLKFYRTIFAKWFHFLIPMLFLLVLIVTSAMQAKILYNQPFILGIRPQRDFLKWICIYLSFVIMLRNKKINLKQIVTVLFIASYIRIALLIIQWILNPLGVNFLHIDLITERYGLPRFYVSIKLELFLVFYFAFKLFNREKMTSLKKLSVYLFIFMILFTMLFITLSRMEVVSAIVGLLLLYFSTFRFTKISTPISIFCGIILTIVFFSTSLGEELLNLLLGNVDFDTAVIRDNGRNFYFDVIKDNLLFGGGMPNKLWDASVVGSGISKNYFYVDNGIFGFVFIYGIVGLIWIISLYCMIVYFSFCLHDKRKNIYLSFLVFNIVGSYTLMPMGSYYSNMMLVYFLIFLEAELVETEKQELTNIVLSSY